MTARARPLAIWLVFVALCTHEALHTRYSADLSAFLPAAPTRAQQLLVEQLRDGPVSRLMLVGIAGGEAAQRAAASRALAAQLRAASLWAAVANGEPVGAEADRALLYARRYALSDALDDATHFSVAGLRTAIGATLDLLASPAGLLVKPLLTHDPTGELLHLLDGLAARGQPALRDGVWSTPDGGEALLLATTRAAGSDTDAQATAVAALRAAWATLAAHDGPAAGLRLELSGPGVFAVQARATIQSEVERLSLLATGLIAALLWSVYRSLRLLVLGLLPMLSGALAGVAAVGAGFGVVHGITLGFGITLIGEAVDYAIYLFVQSGGSAHDDRLHDADRAEAGYWPTVRLGVATSVTGFAALLGAGFPGLAQLGLYSLAGLLSAALVTRHVLPALLPAQWRVRDLAPFGRRLAAALGPLRRARPVFVAVPLAAALLLALRGDGLWHHELAALSPVPAADQALDARLRAGLGAPDVRALIVIDAPDAQAALVAAERLAPALTAQVAAGTLGGYESPARYLPSAARQRARLATLPPADVLRARLVAALDGLPLRAERLEAFVADVEAARIAAPLGRADFDGTTLALALDALLLAQPDGRWHALLPLRAPVAGGTIDATALGPALAAVGSGDAATATLIDLKHESDALYAGYLAEARRLTLGGCAAIALLLAASLRPVRRTLRVLAPLAAAVLTVTAALALAGERLMLLHLVGMLLVVAVGSNYALFFAQPAAPGPTTLASLLLANLTTLLGFGLLGLSSVPVLHALGVVVGPGALLALLYAAAYAPPPDGPPAASVAGPAAGARR